MFFNRGYKRVLNIVKDMRKQRLDYSLRPSVLIVTWFFIGRFPLMPGTVASLSVYPLFHFIIVSSTSYIEMESNFAFLALLLFILGWFAISRFQSITITHDHKSIVIDEVVGQLLTFAIAIKPLLKIGIVLSIYFDYQPTVLAFFAGLILFRFFDIIKPFFIKVIDRRIKNAFGVMFDDICAAVFAGILGFVAYEFYDVIF